MYIGLHVKYPIFLPDFNENVIFWTDFSKNPQISSFVKIRPLGAEIFHADEQTDRQTDRQVEANNRFMQFCEHLPPPEAK